MGLLQTLENLVIGSPVGGAVKAVEHALGQGAAQGAAKFQGGRPNVHF